MRILRQAWVIFFMGFICLSVDAEVTTSTVQRARLLRMNGKAKEAEALLMPLISAVEPTDALIEEYVFAVDDSLKGQERDTKIAGLEKRFGDKACFYVLRAERLGETDANAALAEIENGLKQYPTNVPLAVLKGYFLSEADPSQAVEWLRLCSAQFPQSDIILYGLGSAHIGENNSNENSEKALAAFQSASQMNPGWIEPLLEIASIQMSQTKFSAAFETIRQAEKLEPASLRMMDLKLGLFQMRWNLPLTPEQMWTEVEEILNKKERDLRSLMRAFRIAMIRQEEEKARCYSDELLKKFPDSQQAAMSKTEMAIRQAMQLLKEGRSAEAEAVIRPALQETKEPRYLASLYSMMARAVRADQAKFNAALEKWDSALQHLASEQPDCLTTEPLSLARAYVENKNYKRAIELVQEIKTLVSKRAAEGQIPGNIVEAYTHDEDLVLATAYYETKNFAQAKPLLEALVKADAGDTSVQTKLGLIAIEEKDWATAERYLSSAYRLGFFKPASEDALKKMYIAKNGSEKDWSGYITALKKSSVDTLQKEILETHASHKGPLPEFDLSTYGSERKVSSKSFSGKITVLILWASWCGPCQEELPEFQKFYTKHSIDPGLAMWAVNAQDPLPAIKQFLKDKDYTFPMLVDQNPWEHFGIDGIPYTCIIDSAGIIRFEMTGFNSDYDYMQVMEWLVDAARGEKNLP